MRTNYKINYGLLKADFFLICLLTLILNDFIFKYKFPGLITGKLSDFVGLFIFPYFFSTFFPKQQKLIYWSTAFLFTLWKLPITDEAINSFNALNLIFIHRVKDLSDLIALTILPLSFLYFKKQSESACTISRFQLYFFATLSLFSFTATTIGQKEYSKQMELNETYNIPINKTVFLSEYISQARGFPLNDKDTSFYIYCTSIEFQNTRLTFLGSINKINDTITKLHISKLLKYEISNQGLFRGPDNDTEEYFKTLHDWSFVKILNENLLRTLKAKKLGNLNRIWYDIKPKLDSMNVSWGKHNKH